MLLVLIIIYFLIVVCSFCSFKYFRVRNLCYWTTGIFLIGFAIFCRKYSPDYSTYLLAYQEIIMGYDSAMEYSFAWISRFVEIVFGDSIGVFVVYALLGISLKLWAINKLTELDFLSVAIYLSCYFMLHDMIQIRAGVVSGLLLLSIRPAYDRNYKLFFGLVAIACIFHYSAVALFVLWFVSGRSIKRWFWLVLLAIVYSLNFFNIGPSTYLGNLDLEIANVRIASYYQALQNVQRVEVNVFNPAQLLRCCLFLFLLWKIRLIHEHNKYAYILIKIFLLGLCCLVFFSAIPVIAYRFSELFLIVEIILYPLICYVFVNKNLGKVIPIIIGMCFLIIYYMKFYMGYGG